MNLERLVFLSLGIKNWVKLWRAS